MLGRNIGMAKSNSTDSCELGIVIVTFNNDQDIEKLIASVRVSSGDVNHKLVVVDNCSIDGTADILARVEGIIPVFLSENLGYAAAINIGMSYIGECSFLLVLNPDLVLESNAIEELLAAACSGSDIGAVVPLIHNEDGTIHPSQGYEPCIWRTLADALYGGTVAQRLGLPGEFEYKSSAYTRARDIDWATGAAVLVTADAVSEVGRWSERFFLYSEEVDYFRRIRTRGFRIQFTPRAKVTHRGGGSGRSCELVALQSVNKIRYVERYHGRLYTWVFKTVVTFRHLLRAIDPDHRRILGIVARRNRWSSLPPLVR